MKHQLKVSRAFAYSDIQLLSMPLQHGICFFQPLCPAFPNALRLWFLFLVYQK